MTFEVFIGYDPREALAWRVAAASLQAQADEPVAVRPIWRQMLEREDIYKRPHRMRGNVLWDDISDQPCSTEFSIARFGVPILTDRDWAIFTDVDFLFRADIHQLVEQFDPRYAVMVVKHKHRPVETEKMDGQIQRQYERKNWSSFTVWNMTHASNRAGDWYERLNTWPRDKLHQFGWLKDEQIGELPDGEAWNWLDGYSDPAIDPRAVHFTRGVPSMAGYEHTRYAPEWNRYAQAFVAH